MLRILWRCNCRGISAFFIAGVFAFGWASEPVALFAPPDWDVVAEQHPGIQLYQRTQHHPRRIAVQAARIDLRQPGVQVTTTGRHPDWQAGRKETQRETTTAFIQRKRDQKVPVVLALNANFYAPVANDGGASTLSGLAVSVGQVVSFSEPNRWALLVDEQGGARIQATDPETDLDGVRHAIGAYVAIVRDGTIFGADDHLNPRSAAGICAEGRYLFLLAVDGRRPGHSLGITIREAGEIMRALGAHYAINLDGGGSTAMAWYDPDAEKPVLFNRPSDRPRLAGLPIPGSQERWNAHHIGIVFDDESVSP